MIRLKIDHIFVKTSVELNLKNPEKSRRILKLFAGIFDNSKESARTLKNFPESLKFVTAYTLLFL